MANLKFTKVPNSMLIACTYNIWKLPKIKENTYKVTISALAASTAMLKGSFPSSSVACWLAPRFRNKHTCLVKETTFSRYF